MKKYSVAVLLPLLLIPVFSASAFDARTGDSLSIPSDEVIEEDLFLAGETVRIDGRVDGDLYVAAKTVTITGSIRDGVTVFANTVVISGRVGKGVLAACQDLEIGGEVRGDVKAFCRVFSLETGAQLEGDLVVAGQRVVVSAPVQGYVLGAGSLISIRSSVQSDALFAARSLSLEQGARIGGDLLYMSEKKASISPGVEISGRVLHRVPEFRDRMKKLFPFIILAGVLAKILSFIMMAVVGLALAFIAPKWMFRLSESIKRHPGPSAGWGAILLFGAPIAISIAFSTVVGISLAMIAASAYHIALYLSQIVTALLIGRLLLGMREQGANRGHLFGAFVLGLFLIRLVRFIPGIGMFVWMAAALFGLGAFVVEQTKLRSGNTV